MSTTAKKITTATVLKGVSPSSKALPVISNDINVIIDDVIDIDNRLSDIDGYKVYTALLTQTGGNEPVAIVLKNTLGVTITYSYAFPGIYLVISSDNIFTSFDEHTSIIGSYDIGGGMANSFTAIVSPNVAVIGSTINSIFTDGLIDSTIINNVFEIKIYN